LRRFVAGNLFLAVSRREIDSPRFCYNPLRPLAFIVERPRRFVPDAIDQMQHRRRLARSTDALADRRGIRQRLPIGRQNSATRASRIRIALGQHQLRAHATARAMAQQRSTLRANRAAPAPIDQRLLL